jgi:sugar O-acyltransferase (sialic acid O-acetyltransferase NeuD family)
MTPTRLAIVGMGGHGRECLDIAEAMADAGHSLEILGFFDDSPSGKNRERLRNRGYDHLGSFADLQRTPGVAVCLGIGDGPVRARLDAQLMRSGVENAVLIHPECTIGSEVKLSPGVVLFAGSRITTNVRLGRHVHVNQNATIGHDCTVSDYATVHPQAAVSGEVRLGRASMVGAGAVVLPGISVGPGARIGAGACVVGDVRPDTVVKGVPAR